MNQMDQAKSFLGRMAPSLTPFIGSKYYSGKTKKLFVFGESHYFPEPSKIHLDAERWYVQYSHNDLNKEINEVGYIDTKSIIEEAIEHDFNKAYTIYYRIANALNELGLKYSDEREALQHITYANFFQRPAEKTGESIEVKPIDIRMATEIALLRVQDIQPDLMVFASKKAWNCSSDFREEVKQLPFLYVPHPSCPWWFRSSSRGRGIDQFQGFLNENKWYIP
jgi:hypothetical protein